MIEILDGEPGRAQSRSIARDLLLAEAGYTVLRFWRADAARASRGTGLGLAIVKHVITAAGGTLEASGNRGRGLEVRCVLPP